MGSWSDKSPEWAAVPPQEREKLGLTFNDDGEFWMSYQVSPPYLSCSVISIGTDHKSVRGELTNFILKLQPCHPS